MIRRKRFEKVLTEDIRDLDNIKNTQKLRLFTTLLQQRVSQLIALSNLTHNLSISANTAKSWLSLIEHR